MQKKYWIWPLIWWGDIPLYPKFEKNNIDFKSMLITDGSVSDIRFPSGKTLDGSDAMNPEPGCHEREETTMATSCGHEPRRAGIPC